MLRPDPLQPGPLMTVVVRLLAALPAPRMAQPRVEVRARGACQGVLRRGRGAGFRGGGRVVGLAGGFSRGVRGEGGGRRGGAGGEGCGVGFGGGVGDAGDLAGLVLVGLRVRLEMEVVLVNLEGLGRIREGRMGERLTP